MLSSLLPTPRSVRPFPARMTRPLFLELNTEDKSSIKALNENNPLPASVLSVTRGPEGKLLLASNELDDSKNLVSTLYSVDETDYTATRSVRRAKRPTPP